MRRSARSVTRSVRNTRGWGRDRPPAFCGGSLFLAHVRLLRANSQQPDPAASLEVFLSEVACGMRLPKDTVRCVNVVLPAYMPIACLPPRC